LRSDAKIRFLALGAVLLASAVSACAEAAPRAPAAVAYRHAERLRAALDAHPDVSFAAYLRVIRAFQLVYRKDPQYSQTPNAYLAVGELYATAGRRFANDTYSARAIEAYQFLAHRYPHSRLAPFALYAVAKIYRRDIEDPEAARDAYLKFLKRFPQSPRAAEAKSAVAKIDHELAQWKKREPSSPDQSGTLPNGAQTQTAPTSSVRHSGIAEVVGIQHWVGPNYTRVVIDVGRRVKFQTSHLEHPPRLIFDLQDTRLSPEIARKAFPVEDGFLRRIRVAQFQPNVTRLVLDTPRLENYSVFSLPHPFRLVIDIHGANSSSSDTVGASAEAQIGSTGSRSVMSEKPQGKRVDETASTAGNGGGSDASAISGPSEGAMPASDLTVLPAAPGVAGPPTLTRALGLKIRRIVIDPGHGGHDTGTIGPNGLEEKNLVLAVALRLRRLIVRRLGCQVVMTRSTDRFIPLEERTAIANQDGADLFISIHANASRDPGARGIEIYYLNFTSDREALAVAARENATSEASVFQLQKLIHKIALTEKIEESRDFATTVDRSLATQLDRDGDAQPNRGVKKAPFVVLIGANMPSILAEISFLSNPTDERRLRTARVREEIAQGLYDGIARYAESLGTIRVAQRNADRNSHARPMQ
jgi:N-acetylmuramoyl-L-alanine amidase